MVLCVVFGAALVVGVIGQDLISDLGDILAPSAVAEQQALDLKGEQFWQEVLDSAEDMKLAQHMHVYKATQQAITDLPIENVYVHETLSEALSLLRQADKSVLMQGTKASSVAAQRLSGDLGESPWSFFTGGGMSFLNSAIGRFTGSSTYTNRLRSHVNLRQADILPVLQDVSVETGSVLSNTRRASALAFDVIKYDIYNDAVPKTPKAATAAAYQIVDAVSETRHHFTSFITQAADSLANDVAGQSRGAGAALATASINAELNSIPVDANPRIFSI